MLVRAEVDPRQAERIADIVLHEHEALTGVPDAPQLTLALLNTVDRAVELYRALRQRAEGSIDVLLLHSRFRPADRERQVARLSEKELPPGGRIVVSTQVVEAGIDLDAGAMVTDLAPWASLVQRAGRLNRAGLRTSSPARLVWIDPGEAALPKVHQPYDLDHVAAARAALLELEREGFSPDAIEAYLDQHPKRRSRLLGGRPLSLFLRAPDLIDLFDTDPTLDGDDPDVGRFIRVNEDLDVGIAWRNLPPEGPAPDEPTPAREEVCPVPVSERKQIAALEPWRWSYARRRWERVLSPQDVMPGDLLLVHASRGGYDPQIGWTGRKGAPVDPLLLFPSAPPESDSDDSQSTSPGRWISLGEHTIHVQE
ncbi:MAG: hypothetical protein C4305_10220, partial [Thermoleophilia bacterium]